MRNARVAITGMGAVSAAGRGADSLLKGLKAAKRVFVSNDRFNLDIEVTVGPAPQDCFEDHAHSAVDNPTGRLCLAAAIECLSDVKKTPDGLVLGTSTGGQLNNEEVVFSLLDGDAPERFDYKGHGCMAAPTRLVARALDIQGPVQTISTACTSSANAVALGAKWIMSGRAKRVLAGGGDALCRTTICGFRALELTGDRMCAPFGPDRPGLTLGEGAGFLLLEPLEEVLAQRRPYLAELLSFGMSSDAHHMTAPPEDGAGAEAAMRRAIEAAGLTPGDVTHVNAHGTGTRLNDAAEAAAIGRLFGKRAPVMSCKGLVGHTLGGSGGIEAVASVLAIREKTAFENIGASIPGEDCPIELVPKGGIPLADGPRVLSNSFAFGGNNCALLFGAPEV